MITAEKITLHFKTADSEFAKRLYADWDYFSKCSLVDVLDSFLSTFDSDDIYLEIDRLDLDLGAINQEEFYDEFPRRLRRELERQFRVSLINNTTLTHHNIAEWLRSPTLSRHEKQARLERLLRENPHLVTRFIHESREESERKELVEILEDGSVKEIIYTESESHTEVGVPEYWYHLYRWLYEHYPFNGVAMFGDKVQFKHHLTTKLLTFIQKRGYSTYHTRLSLTIELLMEVFGEEYYLSILKVIYYNQPLDSYDRPLSSDYYYWEIYYILLKASLIEPWQEVKNDEIKEPKANVEVVEKEQKTDMEQRQERDHYTIPNAGLCLLSPWFPRLFAMVGLLTKDQKDFTDQEARVRAVFILQRLVRSQEVEWRDSELAFNRILVGLPFSTPLPKRMELTKEEITIVESMLQGVKTNWGVLKNTSIEGFQSSFIERQGEIRLEDESWRLRVEPRSFDMLLDSLPWAYSLIRLPWLKRWINVSWRDTQEFDN